LAVPSEINADLFYEKIKDVTKKIESADALKAELVNKKSKTTGQLID
jgi:hypothetical protein